MFGLLKQAMRLKLRVDGLEAEKAKLKEELADLKTTKKIEERDIAHLIKCKEEKNAIEYQKKEVELMKTYQQREIQLQDNLHAKVMESLEKHKGELQKIYADIIARLPNVNVDIKRR